MSQFRRIIATVAAALMALSLVPASALAAGTYFGDVADTSEFGSYINQLAAAGVVAGLNGNYYPGLNVTRGEMAKFVDKALGVDMTVSSGAPHFDDVLTTYSLYGYVEASYAKGIVQGRSPRMFVPDGIVTRGEAMKIVMKTAQSMDTKGYFTNNTTGGPHFTDVPASSEFYGFVETAYNLGIIKGYGNGKFGLQDPTHRDQMAKIIANVMNVAKNGPPTTPVGAPARLKLESSDTSLYPDGESVASLTASVLDSQDNVVGGYNGPVSCTTTLGTLAATNVSTGTASLTVTADSGRGQLSLISSTTEGTATVTCETSTLPKAVVQVEFSKSAPKTSNGFGSAHVGGTGTITMSIIDDNILDFPYADDFKTVFKPVVGGCALVEVYVYDDEGDPNNGDNINISITKGQGHLTTDYSDCSTLPAAGTRSVQVVADDNGRALVYIEALADEHEGQVEITAQDLDSTPVLTTHATVKMNHETLKAETFPNKAITTRNDTQIGGPDADVINEAEIWVLLLNENGKPINDADLHEITARFTKGPTEGAAFVGCAAGDPGCNPATVVDDVVDLAQVFDSTPVAIPGLYSVKVLAGSGAGTLTIELRDETAVGQPSTTVTVSVKEPKLNCYTSGDNVGEDDASSILCSLTTDDGVAIVNEDLQCKISSGDGSVDDDPTTSDTNSGNTFFAPMPGVETVVAGGAGAGWYGCQYESEDTIANQQTIKFLITDLDRSSLPTEKPTVTASDDNAGAVTSLEVHPLQNNIGPLEETSVLNIAQDKDGFGIGLLDVTPDCTTLGTPPGNICTQTTTTNNMDISADMGEWGDGAYFYNGTSHNVDGKGMIETRLYNGGGVFIKSVKNNFNIIDNTVKDVTTRSSILVDDAFGVIACVSDENDNPVPGLSTGAGDWTVTNLGVATTRSDLDAAGSEIQPVGDVAGIEGSGCYALSADTDPDVQPGDTVKIKTALTGGPTNAHDDVSVSVKDVTLELMAHPNFTQATNCVTITGVVRDEDHDPIMVDTPGTNGIKLELTKGSGGLIDGDVDAGSCDLAGATPTVFMTLDNGTTLDGNGVYIATYVSDVAEENAEITGFVEGANSRATDKISINVQ